MLGEAAAAVQRARAHAQAIEITADALAQVGGPQAARLEIAREYVGMYAEMVKLSHNFPDIF